MDVTSRRAFSLDSRTVWVEQQLVNQMILPKDNYVLGPGEYTPKVPERNVSTPSLGKFRTPADHFRPFKSSASGARSISSSGSSHRPHSTTQGSRRDSLAAGSAVSGAGSIAQSIASNRSEFTTIHHHHDDRNPYDPKTQFTQTPDPYLGQDTIYESKRHDGIVKLRNTLPFGPNDKPFGERNPTREALPDYDVNFDSDHVKPKPKLGSFPKNKRIHIPTEEEMKQGNQDLEDSPSKVKLRPMQPTLSTSEIASQTGMSVFEIRCNLVPLPKLKTRAPPRLVLDDSCYRNSRLKQPVILTPSVVKKQARLNLFEKIPCIPRAHKSVDFFKPNT